jgi:hypothetical protein
MFDFKSLKSFAQKAGFWVLIFVLTGFVMGSYVMHKYQSIQTEKSILLEGFIYNNKPYDVKERMK